MSRAQKFSMRASVGFSGQARTMHEGIRSGNLRLLKALDALVLRVGPPQTRALVDHARRKLVDRAYGVSEDELPSPRLNVGCGADVWPGWLNADVRPTGELAAHAAQLPFPDGTFASLAAQDVLEHFPREQGPEVVAEWRRVLRPDGWLRLRVPNLSRLGSMLAHDIDLEQVVTNIYGGHRFGQGGIYDTHHWGWTPRSLAADLASWGFSITRNDHEPNMSVLARPRQLLS
jgi:SAM-dependent methyltransferase